MRTYRSDFPLLKQKIDGKQIVYLDSAATALKPIAVVQAINKYYTEYTANVFRGLYRLSEKATEKYEEARQKVAKFINANSASEVIFTRSTTEAINLVAYAWGRLNSGEGDEVVTTVMEHHSNFVPWQQLALENGGVLKILDITDSGFLDIESEKVKSQKSPCLPAGRKVKSTTKKLKLKNIISKKTKLLAITHVSNVLGTINPIKEIVKEVKRVNPQCLVLVDGAQAVPHMEVDVQDLGCDFYAFSGHKMLGPTGIGVLWGRNELLEQMPPFNFGGEMIAVVHLNKTKFKHPPHKFEAGTPHIAGVIGLGAAIDYLVKLDMDKVREHEIELTKYALTLLNNIYYLSIYGPKKAEDKSGVLAFNLFTKEGKLIHPHDVAQILNEDNICTRSGHHCAMPLHERLGITASVRASFYIYNTKEDVDELVEGLRKVIRKLG